MPEIGRDFPSPQSTVWQYPTHVMHAGFQNLIETVQRKTLRETAPSIEELGTFWNTTYSVDLQPYHDIALICHSMGGLIVKSWILDVLERGESTKLAALRHIAFYATPHQGAPITEHASWNQQLKNMQVRSTFIEHIDERWYDHVVFWKNRHVELTYTQFNRYIPHLVLAGLQDKVVPSKQATIRGMPLTKIAGDHSGAIQPTDRNDARYRTWIIDLEKTFAARSPEQEHSLQLHQHEQRSLSEEPFREDQPIAQGQEQAHTHPPSPYPTVLEYAPTTSSSELSPVLTVPSSGKPPAQTIFLAYAEKDERLLHQLETHLSVLRQNELISLWHKRLLIAGADAGQEIDQWIERSSIILFLISPDFLASDTIHQGEVKRALERQEAGQARVAPVLLRSADWKDTAFGHLHPLPRNGRPIANWTSRDDAFLDVVQGIKQIIGAPSKQSAEQDDYHPTESSEVTKPHIFPPLWNVPYHFPPFFTGRDQIVEELFHRFVPQHLSGPIPAWSLTGLGGLGKTQTAVAYAYHHRAKYQAVLWANAETEKNLATSFTNIAKLLALPNVDLQYIESVIEGMQAWFKRSTDWLLIIDNANDLVMIRRFLPAFANGHVLLTSQAAAPGGQAQPQVLRPLSPDDGALCLLRRAQYIRRTEPLESAPSPANVRAARELSELMGGLPLALEQAGAYIETTGRSVTGYLDLYRKYRPKIQQGYYGSESFYREAVAFAWNIARESVERANSVASELLYLCAFLAPDAIPYTLFPKDTRILGPSLGPVAADPIRLDLEIMAILRNHSLIQNQANHDTDLPQVFIHRVLQEVLRDSMNDATELLWAERAVCAVVSALDKEDWAIIQTHAQRCLSHAEHWQMNFREADILRQWCAEHP